MTESIGLNGLWICCKPCCKCETDFISNRAHKWGTCSYFQTLLAGGPNPKNEKTLEKKTKNKKQTQIKTTIFSDSLDWGGGLGKSPKIFFFAYMLCFFVLCFSNILLFSAFWACVCVFSIFKIRRPFSFSGGGPVCDFFLSR